MLSGYHLVGLPPRSWWSGVNRIDGWLSVTARRYNPEDKNLQHSRGIHFVTVACMFMWQFYFRIRGWSLHAFLYFLFILYAMKFLICQLSPWYSIYPNSYQILSFAPYSEVDRLCGIVVSVPGYRSRCHGFDSQQYQFFWKGVRV
jgi:hypothetical protein